MTRSVGARLIALLVVALLGVYYIAFDAVGVHLWNKPFTVNVMLPAAGGLYSDAAVTYRGVDVGKVSSVELQPHDVKVALAIDHGTKIPANVNASVRELTAAAEQYMDLVPPGPAGPATNPPDPPGVSPYLTAGSLIGENRTSVPTTVGTLLNSLNSLVDSVHASNLNTISTALAEGLNNAGPALRAIINNGEMLLEALSQETQPTIAIIQQGNHVLTTLDDTSNDLTEFSAGLDELSTQVKDSNTALTNLLKNGATGTTDLNSLLTSTSTATIGVINGLSDTVGLANARQGATQALFSILPVVASNAALTVSGGSPRFQVQFNTQNTVCPYTSTMVEPTSLVSTVDLSRNCATSAPDLLQRGADTAPTPPGGNP